MVSSVRCQRSRELGGWAQGSCTDRLVDRLAVLKVEGREDVG